MYLTVNTLLEEIVGKSTRPTFFSKGCGQAFKIEQESSSI